ncbi:ABC transporter B family member 13-like, partial [Trifolium medium]|nr:ABC transporter B family member 13-like [Trifolium medium]
DIVKGSQALGSVFRILHRRTTINSNDSNSKMITEVKGESLSRKESCSSGPKRLGEEYCDYSCNEIL